MFFSEGPCTVKICFRYDLALQKKKEDLLDGPSPLEPIEPFKLF